MTAAAPAEMTDRQLAARVWRTYLKPRWKGVAVALVCAGIVAGLSGLLVQLLEPAMNDLLVKPKPGAIVVIPLTIIAYALVRTVTQVLQSTLVNRIGHGIVGDVQLELFGRMVRADLARLKATHTGAFVSQVLYDAGLIREAATTGVINYTQNVLMLLAMLWVMGTSDPILAGLVLLTAPFASRLMRRFSRRSKKAAKGAMAATSLLSTALMESLDGVRVVKMENREDYEEARVADVIRERQRHIINPRARPVVHVPVRLARGRRGARGREAVGRRRPYRARERQLLLRRRPCGARQRLDRGAPRRDGRAGRSLRRRQEHHPVADPALL